MVGIPMHDSISAIIRKEIQEGEHEVGDRLPTAKEGASRLGVSTATYVRAMKLLASQGMVEAMHGRAYTVKAISTPTGTLADIQLKVQVLREELDGLDAMIVNLAATVRGESDGAA